MALRAQIDSCKSPGQFLIYLQLKPYVSYKVEEISQSEFTAEDLFNECYAKKIVADFKSGTIDVETVEKNRDEYLRKPS